MIDGILILDKPEGITSAKAVSKIKNSLQLKKAGHIGTLDPFATGLLIICLNRATKIAQYLLSLDKLYTGTMILGISTNTQDLKGVVQKIKPIDQRKIQPEVINKVFQKYQGEILQIPPMFSAIKFKGSKLYSLARKGIQVKLEPRKIRIIQLDVINIKYDFYPSISFQVKCSKGTYVRTLCCDIGETLGYGAYMSNLRRIGIGEFLINQSVQLDQFLRLSYENKCKKIVPLDQALKCLNKIVLPKNSEILDKMQVGLRFSEKQIRGSNQKHETGLDEIFTVYSFEGKLLAIGKKLGTSFNQPSEYRIEKVLI